MAESITFTPPVTGPEAPPAAEQAPQLTGVEKALADTKAELTRVQQELAALKKGAEAPSPEASPPPAATEQPATPAEGTPPAQEQTPEQKAAADAVAAAGLDVSVFQTEFDTTGDISADSRDKLAEGLKGLFGAQARQVVDQFIDGQKAASATRTSELFAAGGGQDGYAEMVAWAKTALTPAEIAQFDRTIQSGDHNAALFAIKGLRSRFEGANGHEPKLINADAPAAGGAGFRSTAEMVRAMSDPRYHSDPAYRREVEEKTKRSNF